MPQSYTNLLIHVIFSVKDRRAMLSDSVRGRVFANMGGVVRECRSKAVSIGGAADHCHMLVDLRADTSLSDLMRVVKTNTSKWIHDQWPALRDFAWQPGYAAFSVSESNRKAVVRYIENQAAHHARLDYDEELAALLEKHGMSLEGLGHKTE